MNACRISHDDLRHFRGSDVVYLHPLNQKVRFTEGVHFLAENAEAYWLIDAIASYYGTETMNRAIAADSQLEGIQFWRLDVVEDSATLTARADSDVSPFIKQQIPYTDFPLDHVRIWSACADEFWTLLLPSEY